MKKTAFICLIVFIFSHLVFAQKPIRDLRPTVILVSLDGFRYDYIDKFKTPVLNQLAKEGVRAKWMTPSFPSKTFPNHYTIATGLYPEHHGIIENNIYDFGTTFGLSKTEEVQNPRWWLGEPLWVTAEKQNQIAAAYFFPGTETAIQGVKPDYFRAYNGKVPNELRVDKILSYLDLPAAKRPTFLTLYFSDTDDAGHEFSPDSEETRYSALNVDRLIGQLMNGLKQRRIDKKVNLIVVSDHGMQTIDLHNAVFLDDYFDTESLTDRVLWTDEIVQVFPKQNKTEEIMSKIKNVRHATCWRKNEIPERFHYRASPRIAPVVCSTEEGWMLTTHKRYEDRLKSTDINQMRGGHGYDNQLESMRATFIAHGAAFKKGYVAEPFENVEVYNLMCRILGLTPAKNDGNFEKIKDLLR
jgi:predicted AlkP superfamily pyrophosphatase or phosphodiesterase